MRIAICDDDMLQREEIRRLILNDIEIRKVRIFDFNDGEDLIAAYKNGNL